MFTDKPFPRSGANLTVKEIAAFEQTLGAVLPDDYRRFLLETNGGCPAKAWFPIRIADYPEDEMAIDVFFNIDEFLISPNKKAQLDSFSLEYSTMAGLIPSDVLSIAEIVGDSRLVLYTHGPKRGQVDVIVWDVLDQQQMAPTLADVRRAMRFVTKSFTEFYASLYAPSKYG